MLARWFASGTPVSSAVLATAGGLLFAGDADGQLAAYDQTSQEHYLRRGV
jgi:hypothetical protein